MLITELVYLVPNYLLGILFLFQAVADFYTYTITNVYDLNSSYNPEINYTRPTMVECACHWNSTNRIKYSCDLSIFSYAMSQIWDGVWPAERSALSYI